MAPDAKPWVEKSDYDLGSAEDMMRLGRYVHVCQQALEKRLKALIIHRTQQMPARTHSLPRLAIDAGIQPTPDQGSLLAEMTKFSIETRYPETNPTEPLSKEHVQDHLDRTREFVQWCDQQMK
jgi:HEPN domain-containing protein